MIGCYCMKIGTCGIKTRSLTIGALLILSIPSGQAQTGQFGYPATPPLGIPSTSRGSEKAPITVVVFSDFESFPCARSATVITGLVGQSRNVRLIFKNAPAVSNPNALLG